MNVKQVKGYQFSQKGNQCFEESFKIGTVFHLAINMIDWNVKVAHRLS